MWQIIHMVVVKWFERWWRKCRMFPASHRFGFQILGYFGGVQFRDAIGKAALLSFKHFMSRLHRPQLLHVLRKLNIKL